tara:strand:- start:253 stop:405 length:153 start_codon:yes stop_codon:yes gene_type:complete
MMLTLELSSEHVEAILNALAERPLRETIAAFLAVQQQVREQSQGEPSEFT